MTTTDRIEKQVLLKAPLARVWRAISDAKEFGQWFGVTLDGPLVAGKTLRGTFGPEVTAEMLEKEQQALGLAPQAAVAPTANDVFCTVERVDPQTFLSFRWRPYGVDAAVDPHGDSMTLVEFRLEEKGPSTLLTIVESGFDRVQTSRRQAAFKMNDHGWTIQTQNIARHVQGT
jgi:uncharacterized protein YndB with AHSA1/START domain